MAPASWAKPVRMLAKARLKVGVQYLAHHLLHHFRRPGRKSERAYLPTPFRDVDPFHGSPSPPFLTDEVNHGVDFLSGHAVHGFSCGVWRHGSIIGVETRIRLEVQLWIVELPIQPGERKSSLTAISHDTQDCC